MSLTLLPLGNLLFTNRFSHSCPYLKCSHSRLQVLLLSIYPHNSLHYITYWSLLIPWFKNTTSTKLIPKCTPLSPSFSGSHLNRDCWRYSLFLPLYPGHPSSCLTEIILLTQIIFHPHCHHFASQSLSPN